MFERLKGNKVFDLNVHASYFNGAAEKGPLIMLKTLFKKRTAQGVGDTLYGAAVAQARQAAFYARLGVDDRIDARFELYTLHVLLLILRLRDEPGERGGQERGAEVGQSLFDVYVSSLDHALRELGVGDVSMARKMRSLGEALYGRMTAYEAPIRAGDAESLAQALARNVYAVEDSATAAPLADYALRARAALADQSFDALLAGPQWPEIIA
ncbi:ubiquinol-cytochrome C chaperone family protein [Brevundimonas sp.]|uniref:ubiquinol-cytochrome C chaperone family protein n=1 Tax=Brevundimonas sp. TaxID=1871086 RepID=UPI003BAA32A6